MLEKDLLIVGGGPGGYVAALRAAKAGLTVALAEERSVGGVCLNEGCIPTKTLLNSAKIYAHAQNGAKYGVSADELRLDHAAVLKRKTKVVRTLVTGVKGQLKRAAVELLNAHAEVLGPRGAGFAVRVGDAEYQAKQLIIATGSAPVLPPLAGLAQALTDGFALTSREALELAEIPPRLTVVGGGVVGLELALYFQIAGSQVTVVEMLPTVDGAIDADIAAVLLDHCQKLGVQFQLESRVTAVEAGRVNFENAAGAQSLATDRVLVAIGRKPVLAGFGLETLGLATERGALVTDECLRTNVAGVYAVGDVNGKLMLAHTASREGEVAVNTILGKRDRLNYAAVPQVLYTLPEVAQVGLTLAEAEAQGLNVRSATLPLGYSGRYVAENEPSRDFCRVLVDAATGRVLGVALITPYASEIIPAAALIVEHGLTVADVQRTIFPHPTVAEIMRETIFEL